ncbi:MAG: FHA domain-containing protein [Clostridia bacterium]|nr:FHA domain-containing protein [Clostridia bacterium]
MEFVYENQGQITYLSYAISKEDILDTMTLGMMNNKNIPGFAPNYFTHMDTTRYFKYNVSSKIPVSRYLSGMATKKKLLNVYSGIVSAVLSAKQNMIDLNLLVLDPNYVYIDAATGEVSMICLPLQQVKANAKDLKVFLKKLLFDLQFDPSENGDYVAKVISHLNAAPVFSAEAFKAFLDSMSDGSVRRAPETKPVGAVNPPVRPMNTIPQTAHTEESGYRAPFGAPAQSVPTSAQRPPVQGFGETQPLNSQPVKREQPAPQPPVQNAPIGFAANVQQPPVQGFSETQPLSGPPVKREQPAPQPPVQTKPVIGETQPLDSRFAPQPPAQNKPVISETQPMDSRPAQLEAKKEPVPVANGFGQGFASSNATGQSAGFGETIVLGSGPVGAAPGGTNIGETTALGVSANPFKNPHLIRARNHERINLNKPVFRVGKEKSYVDYFISDNTAISRSHANFISRDGEYFVIDTNSTNHTYINGVRIPSNVETKIRHGDKIRLANEDFDFNIY